MKLTLAKFLFYCEHFSNADLVDQKTNQKFLKEFRSPDVDVAASDDDDDDGDDVVDGINHPEARYLNVRRFNGEDLAFARNMNARKWSGA